MSSPVVRTIFHVNDVVRVVKPERFIRVGYPLTKEQALQAAATRYDEKIYAFMREVSTIPDEFTVHNADVRLYNDLVDVLGSYWLRLKGYGGKERKIYTETDESLRGSTWRVLSKRIVKTGTYNNGSYQGGWDGEPDYLPPHLANEQSHVLLTLELIEGKCDPWGIEIEAINIELAKRQ